MIPRALCIDPSTSTTGWATYDANYDLHHGTIRPRIRHNGRWHNFTGDQRNLYIAGRIRDLAVTHSVEFVALESQYGGAHANTIIILSRLRGVITSALWGAQIPYIEIAPSSIKLYGTGNGRADKEAMKQAARDDLGWDGTSDDEADALLMHALVCDALGAPRITLDPHDRRRNALPAVIGTLDTLRTRSNTW